MPHDGAAIALRRSCVPDGEERLAVVDLDDATSGGYRRHIGAAEDYSQRPAGSGRPA